MLAKVRFPFGVERQIKINHPNPQLSAYLARNGITLQDVSESLTLSFQFAVHVTKDAKPNVVIPLAQI